MIESFDLLGMYERMLAGAIETRTVARANGVEDLVPNIVGSIPYLEHSIEEIKSGRLRVEEELTLSEIVGDTEHDLMFWLRQRGIGTDQNSKLLALACDEIERLKHDLERSMANHTADLNADASILWSEIKEGDICDRCGRTWVQSVAVGGRWHHLCVR